MQNVKHLPSATFVLIQAFAFSSYFVDLNFNSSVKFSCFITGGVLMIIGLIFYLLKGVERLKNIAFPIGSVFILTAVIFILVGGYQYINYHGTISEINALWGIISLAGILALQQALINPVNEEIRKQVPLFFVFLQLSILAVFYVRLRIRINQYRINIPDRYINYLDWSIAGCIVMLQGLIISSFHLKDIHASKRVVIRIGVSMILIGMLIHSIGEIFLIAYGYNYLGVAFSLITLAGGSLAFYEVFEYTQ